MKTLTIDSSDNKKITVGIRIGKKEYFIKQKANSKKAQVILPQIEKILDKHSLELTDLDSIEVNTGPGSFTGIRVGTSIANTLGIILKIPINGKDAGELVEPFYK